MDFFPLKTFVKVNETNVCISILLPPANEVFEDYVFTRVCHSVHGGGSTWAGTPQDQVHCLGPGTPPPPGPGTPLSQTRYTPWDQVHPQTRYTPHGTRYTPWDQVHPLVHLLECILVQKLV